ncbi:hypothetical protein B0H16DRAFT_1886892 [Mycena metata]|uniref:Uncharacterized protein n=1 Tax=Mycena metata TaxID=1033252 RepID=A0AAD7IZ81_9AGAR|nr:hypothetical protein B0H16DRAFT_1886892 [Mycena metata]
MCQHLQTLVGQFTVIVNYLGTDITAMQGMPPFTAQADCDTIVSALGSFVQVHQALLATVIGKHAIFVQFGATAPVAAVLRTLEATIDSFAFAMINLIPCGADSVKRQEWFGHLGRELNHALRAVLHPQPTLPNCYPRLCRPLK